GFGVVELEPRPGHGEQVVDAGPLEITCAYRIHVDRQTALLVDPVVVPRLGLEIQRVFETAAAAAADRDAEAVRGIYPFSVSGDLHHLDTLWRQRHRRIRLVD